MATPETQCEQCGQLTATTDAWSIRGWCPKCRAGQYGGGETHERARLFEPAPVQLEGQLSIDD